MFTGFADDSEDLDYDVDDLIELESQELGDINTGIMTPFQSLARPWF